MRPRLTVAIILACVSPALAQELPTVPAPEKRVEVIAFDLLRSLTPTFFTGDCNTFWKPANDILSRIRAECGDSKHECPAGDDHVLLTWVGALPTSDDPVLMSAVVRSSPGEPYARVVPGLSRSSKQRLFEVFVTPNERASIVSYYVAKPLPDPLLQQVPLVVERFIGPLFATLDRLAPRPTGPFDALSADRLNRDVTAAGASPPDTVAIVRRVDLPVARGGVDVALSVTLPLTPADLTAAVAALKKRFVSLGYSAGTAGTALDDSTAALIKVGTAGGCSQQSRTNANAKPAPALPAELCREMLHAAVSSVMGPLRAAPATPREGAMLQELDVALRALVDGLKPKILATKVALDNSPLTHFAFGLATAYAWKLIGAGERAKLDKNQVVYDPMSRALQMVTFNWSPWGYQDKTQRRWNGRAFARFFVGVPFLPDPGVSGGLVLNLLPNLGVNVGAALLFISRPVSDLEFGDFVDERMKDADGKPTGNFIRPGEIRSDPFRPQAVTAWFAGASYNFK